jgi:hypothetical protein
MQVVFGIIGILVILSMMLLYAPGITSFFF